MASVSVPCVVLSEVRALEMPLGSCFLCGLAAAIHLLAERHGPVGRERPELHQHLPLSNCPCEMFPPPTLAGSSGQEPKKYRPVRGLSSRKRGRLPGRCGTAHHLGPSLRITLDGARPIPVRMPPHARPHRPRSARRRCGVAPQPSGYRCVTRRSWAGGGGAREGLSAAYRHLLSEGAGRHKTGSSTSRLPGCLAGPHVD